MLFLVVFCFFFSSRRRHTRCALVTGVQTCALPIYVLACIEWRNFDPRGIADHIPDNAQAAESQLQRIQLADDGDELLTNSPVANNQESLTFDPAYVVRLVSDLVPNPFVAREIVGRMVRSEENTSELQSLMRISYAV